MKKFNQTTSMLTAGLLLSALTAQAQLTWDPDLDLTNNGGAGTWDTTTSNWWNGAADTTWDNSGANEAIFGDAGADYSVSVADGGVTVGDLTYNGSDTLQFKSVTDNLGSITIASGGATWNTNGGTIQFLNNQTADISLSASSGDTLSVVGGGSFLAGVNSNGANWSAAGATIDFTTATDVKGNGASIGQFGTIKLAGGSSYTHAQNFSNTYANNWDLGAGTVTFDNSFSWGVTLSGVISGDGQLKVVNFANQELTLTNDANSFSGGIEIGNASRLKVTNAARLGSADNDITLTDGGILKAEGVDFGSSREIILSGTGGSIINAGVNSFGGHISGSGGLEIGNAAYTNNVNVMTLSGTADYEGETKISRGTLKLGADNALSADSVINISGVSGKTMQLELNGYSATIGGLTVSGGGTRQISNNGGSASTLTFDVANGESYTYNANVVGSNAINIVKTGDGTQTFGRNGGYNTALGDITVNGGELIWNNNSAATQTGTVTVNAGGTLSGSGILGGAVTVSGNLNPGNSPGTMSFTEDLTLTGTAITNLEFTGTGLAGEFDVLLGDTGNTLTAGGTLNLVVDGYTAVLNDSFLVFEDWASFSGSFSSITGTDLGDGLSFDTSSLLIDGTLTVVPEPSTYALLAGMLAFFAIALRRRVK